jgi:adenosine deaminase
MTAIDFSASTDLHVHLYGCLTPEDIADEIRLLQAAGGIKAKELHDRLNWFAVAHRDLTGVTPEVRDLLTGDVALIKHAYLVEQACDFPTFQARFNLAIAVFPLRADRLSALERVFPRLDSEGITNVELRLPLPPALDFDGKRQLFRQLAASFAKGGKQLVMTLPRPQLAEAYATFKTLLQDCPDRAAISGIDLCGDEEPYPAHQYRDFFAQVHRDFGSGLDLLPHVGETCRTLSLASSARRVAEMASLGVTRLGHGTALGLAPEAFSGLPVIEDKAETDYHVRWLADNAAKLRDLGFAITSWPTATTYTPEVVAATRSLQDALLKWVAETNVPIECCPTSNLRLGQLGNSPHPIRRFVDNGIHCVVCSDDPGIFATTLRAEQELARKWLS